jgi:nucleotide-binding universal stress UspA family protein
MYNKILVPLDGSTLSEGVLPYVRSIARALHSPVELLRVNDPAEPGAQVPAVNGAEYLEKIAASLSGITAVSCAVEQGYPAAVIVDRAAEQSGTLIAMATRGYSGPLRWPLGSVAEKALHATKSHLLLVRPIGGDSGGEARWKTVLVPLDGSELAEKVLPTVADLTACLKLEAVLIHVLIRFYFGSPDALLPVFGGNVPNQQELWAQAGANANQYLTEKVEQLRAQGLPRVSSLLIEDGPEGAAAAIIELARNTADNLMIMSTHGRSGIARWVLGSVTQRVVRHTNDPVIVIPPQS